MLSHAIRHGRPQVSRFLHVTRSLSAVPFESPHTAGDVSKSSETTNPVPNFNDTKAAYEPKSTAELLRAAVSLQLCKIPFLVTNAEPLLRAGYRVSSTLTNAFLKQTLYGHFCAGEDQARIQPVIKKLHDSGVGNILDYAAESDDLSTPPAAHAMPIQSSVAREYDYESEAKCDQHLETFMQCINDVAAGSKDGYAAVKVTALGNPKLLSRMSQAINEAKRLFQMFDKNGDGFVSRDEFKRSYKRFFYDDDETIQQIFEEFDPDHTGQIDYISWSMMLDPKDLPKITATCRDVGPLAMATPTNEEIELIEAMYNRGHILAQKAADVGTRLLIDAEQVRYQPAIDKLVLDLQRIFNSGEHVDRPVIYNTYQCYLKDALERLHEDVKRSELFGFHFGAKLVRGAYMESERELAVKEGFPSPVHDSIEDTHKSYNEAVDFLLKHSSTSDKRVELMCATHNQESIEKAIDAMNRYKIDRKSSTICFAQLYGMYDHLSFNLGRFGYRAYKYLPYGEVNEVMPYLLRRANENSAIVGATASELAMIQGEIGRRMKSKIGLAA
eukprot:scaffold7703_cov127-Cylindrotheca_fusiformis.AAC.14